MAPLADNLTGLMALQPNPKPLAGTYRFVVSCIEAMEPYKSYGDYVTAIDFDKPGNWKVKAASGLESGPVAGAETGGSEPGKSGSRKGRDKKSDKESAGDKDPGGSKGDALPAEGDQVLRDRAAAATGVLGADAVSDDSTPWWVLPGVGLAVLGGIPLALRRSGLKLSRRDR